MATETGLKILLKTVVGAIEVPTTQVIGNVLIGDIPNMAIAELLRRTDAAIPATTPYIFFTTKPKEVLRVGKR